LFTIYAFNRERKLYAHLGIVQANARQQAIERWVEKNLEYAKTLKETGNSIVAFLDAGGI